MTQMTKHAAILALLTGCGEFAHTGVTQGGAQDIELTRTLIENGMIPDQEHYTAEGLFSQHDLPIDGEPCAEILCPRAKAAIHSPLDGSPQRMMVQLGFGTKYASTDLVRPDLDVVAVVDISGSMGDELDVVREAMFAMIDQMTAADSVSLVTFGSKAKVLQRRIFMDADGKEQMREALRKLEIGGSTDVESGMQEGYAQFDVNSAQSHRMMLFTDAQPNTGVTEQSRFVEMVRDAAADGIGTTVFGTGWDLGSELAEAISNVRGGSYHFLDVDTVERLFVEEFDFNVTPVGYDLSVEMLPSMEHPVEGVFGAAVDGDAVSIGASTLFLSARNGGIAVALSDIPEMTPAHLGGMTIRYQPVGQDDVVEEHLEVSWQGGVFMADADDVGVLKVTALVDEFEALNAAAEFCDGTVLQDDAMAVIEQTAARLETVAEQLGADEALQTEAAMMRALHENVGMGLPSCATADVYVY